ncbi:MAG: ribulose-phosphate 3-epimerase [Lachnospiraceae bacterium]|jgi:ribulose-phosphate 3-epimerase|nr:ribulose-phosphate 3-epimerase [Lachnospiraceae bacterium]
MYILAPSILGADFSMLDQQIKAVSDAGARYLHLDVMDGIFVPSISFGMPVISAIRKCSDQFFDVHMMVKEPGRYVEDMKQAGADLICVHQEACIHLDRTLHQIHQAGLKAGVAINPATPVEMLDCVLDQVDQVLIMSVNPGYGSQKFIPYTLNKIRKLRQILKERGLQADIQVDGGVTLSNVKQFLDAGANILVSGSAVFVGDGAENTRAFMKILNEYEAREQ